MPLGIYGAVQDLGVNCDVIDAAEAPQERSEHAINSGLSLRSVSICKFVTAKHVISVKLSTSQVTGPLAQLAALGGCVEVSGGSVEQPTRRESVMRSAERWPTSRAWISPLNLALAALALASSASGASICTFVLRTQVN